MNRKNWDNLVAHNPMLIEIQRFRRRFLTFSGNNAMNSAVLTLCLICYAGLVLFVISGAGNFPPIPIVVFQTGLFTFFAPGMLHGAVAGERERRSWDLLLVAPVSKAQIIAGKFIGALAALGIGAGLLGIPILIAAALYRQTNWYHLALSEMVSLSFIMAVCAFTILISARVKRPFMALGATLGSLAMGLLVLPMLIAAMIAGAGNSFTDAVLVFHPFYVLMKIYDGDSNAYYRDTSAGALWGLPQVAIYTVIGIILVVWAARTLNYAENEVRFLPGGKKDA